MNTLTPGPIDTPLTAKSAAPAELQAEMERKTVPMGRIGTFADTAAEIKVAGGITGI